MSLDLRKIRYFVAVYEEGSIARAAQRENVVQPAVSVQIKQFERALSVKLFERSAQGVQATAAGQHFYKLCSELLRNVRSTQQQMLDFGGEIAGSITIGLMPSICRGPLGEILTQYSEQFPAVGIKVLEAYSGTLAERVVAGELDLALCNRPASQSRLKLRLLAKNTVVLVSGERRKLTPWKPYDLANLNNLKLVLPSSQHSIRRLIDRQIKDGAIRPDRIIDIDGLGATMEVVQAGDWSTLLPSIAVINDLGSSRITINPITSPLLTSDIYELRAPERPLSLAGQKFVQMVQDKLLLAPDRMKRNKGYNKQL